jgi:uncharacterized membrane protein YvbJ
MDDFDWFESESGNRLGSAIYNCTDCSKKVAHGDNFCRHCGVKFTPAMCAKMKNNLTILADKNFHHIVIIMIVALVIILGTVLS